MKLKRSLLLLALLLGGSTCADEATPEDLIAAICARRDECDKTNVQESCRARLTYSCPEGKTFDGEAGHTCVERIKTMRCDDVSDPVWVLVQCAQILCK